MIPIYLNENERAKVDDIYDTVLELIEFSRNIERNISELNNRISNINIINIKTNICNAVSVLEAKRTDNLYEQLSKLSEKNINLED